jgi:hypothetical protein
MHLQLGRVVGQTQRLTSPSIPPSPLTITLGLVLIAGDKEGLPSMVTIREGDASNAGLVCLGGQVKLGNTIGAGLQYKAGEGGRIWLLLVPSKVHEEQ